MGGRRFLRRAARRDASPHERDRPAGHPLFRARRAAADVPQPLPHGAGGRLRNRHAHLSLAIAAITLAIGHGIAMAFAVLYLPLIAEFGSTRPEAVTVQSAVLLVGGFGAPLIGWAFHPLAPRRLFPRGAPRRSAAAPRSV